MKKSYHPKTNYHSCAQQWFFLQENAFSCKEMHFPTDNAHFPAENSFSYRKMRFPNASQLSQEVMKLCLKSGCKTVKVQANNFYSWTVNRVCKCSGTFRIIRKFSERLACTRSAELLRECFSCKNLWYFL